MCRNMSMTLNESSLILRIGKKNRIAKLSTEEYRTSGGRRTRKLQRAAEPLALNIHLLDTDPHRHTDYSTGIWCFVRVRFVWVE